MQKVFLIGNGFDLAHGLKTGYLDFMVWLYEHDEKTFVSFNELLLKNYLKISSYIQDDDVNVFLND